MQIPIIVDFQVVPQVLDYLKEDIIVANVEIFFVQFIVQIILDLINLLNIIQEVYYQEDAIIVQQIIYNGKRTCGKWEKKMYQGGQVLLITNRH